MLDAEPLHERLPTREKAIVLLSAYDLPLAEPFIEFHLELSGSTFPVTGYQARLYLQPEWASRVNDVVFVPFMVMDVAQLNFDMDTNGVLYADETPLADSIVRFLDRIAFQNWIRDSNQFQKHAAKDQVKLEDIAPLLDGLQPLIELNDDYEQWYGNRYNTRFVHVAQYWGLHYPDKRNYKVYTAVEKPEAQS